MPWPELADGTVDWMTVFQDPKTGLIPLLDEADTSEKLRDCFATLIESLFSRDGDESIRQTYFEILEETFEGASGEKALKAQKTKIRMVMMRVMNDRIKRSREYASMKAMEGEADVRRAEDPQPETV